MKARRTFLLLLFLLSILQFRRCQNGTELALPIEQANQTIPPNPVVDVQAPPPDQRVTPPQQTAPYGQPLPLAPASASGNSSQPDQALSPVVDNYDHPHQEHHTSDLVMPNVTLLENQLRTSYFNLYQQAMNIKIAIILKPLQLAIDRLQKHKVIAMIGQQTEKQRQDWLQAGEVTLNALVTQPPQKGAIFELMKASQLMDCVDVHAINDVKSLDQGIKFKYNEQNPDPWVKAAADRIQKMTKLVNELSHLADD